MFLAVSHYLCHFFACHHNSIDFYAKIGQGNQNSMTGFTRGLRCFYVLRISMLISIFCVLILKVPPGRYINSID